MLMMTKKEQKHAKKRLEKYRQIREWMCMDLTRTPAEAQKKFGVEWRLCQLIVERGYSSVPFDTYEEYIENTEKII